MTNEELAVKIQAGQQNLMPQLWEQTHRLIHQMMKKYYPFCNRCGIEPEDLKQCGYFAVVNAVKTFDTEKGLAFSTYLNFSVKKAAREALGFINSRTTPPPFVISLDEPIGCMEDENLTRLNTVPDENAVAEFERIQDDLYLSQLRECLNGCLDKMPPEQAATIRARYFEGKTLKDIANEKGTNGERIRQLEQKALRELRKPRHAHELHSYQYFEAADTRGYGLKAFRNRGFVSQVEVLAGTYSGGYY